MPKPSEAEQIIATIRGNLKAIEFFCKPSYTGADKIEQVMSQQKNIETLLDKLEPRYAAAEQAATSYAPQNGGHLRHERSESAQRLSDEQVEGALTLAEAMSGKPVGNG